MQTFYAAGSSGSEANGEYVSAEFHDTGAHFGMLRARQPESIGASERLELVPQSDGWFTLRYTFNAQRGRCDEPVLRLR